jgi:hypothetical protein
LLVRALPACGPPVLAARARQAAQPVLAVLALRHPRQVLGFQVPPAPAARLSVAAPLPGR